MDKSSKQTKGKQGEISLAGIDHDEAGPVHSSTLMEEFQKSPVSTKPAPAGNEKGYEFDNGDEEEDSVQALSDEDVIRQ